MTWEAVVREVSREQIGALASTALLDEATPKLIPLETLPGRNHAAFSPVEEPPWRWRVDSVVVD